MSNILLITQVFFTVVMGMYFFSKMRRENADTNAIKQKSKREAEHLNSMRKIHLTEPMTEQVRPCCVEDIVGQEDGLKAIKAALCGPNPQHILIYGPPGVGKTAAARVALEYAKQSKGTPFKKDAKFVEADATILQYDERQIADGLCGSVHDPIYQGAGEYGTGGIPEPKEGAVSKAHGGVLFLDEIGELPNCQMNKLLKILEDRKVMFESAYYSETNKNIPTYIHDIFQNGIPADFRLIGATTRSPEEIPEAVRSRCVEVFFNPLSELDIEKIIRSASARLNIMIDERAVRMISKYAKNGRNAVKILQMAKNAVYLEDRVRITAEDAAWALNSCRYLNAAFKSSEGKIIDVSLIKPIN